MQKILIVEDDKLLREGLVEIINSEGYFALATSDSTQAGVLLSENEAALVLLDIMLPGKDGITFCQELRKTTDTPVIFLTARDEEVDVVRSLDAGI